ncbi:MAG: PsbP-related protein [Candidatus Saccharimonadales bacterium]
MKKLNQKGLGVVEGLLILVIIGIIGFVIYYVRTAQNKMENTDSSSSSVESQPEVYERTSKVPDDWKSYKDDKYPISFSYPADWDVIPEPVNKFNPYEPGYYDYEIGIGDEPQSPDEQLYDVGILIKRQSLEEAVATYKKEVLLTKPDPAKIFSEKTLTIDGNLAKELHYQPITTEEDGNEITGDIVRKYFVYANGYVYDLPEVYDEPEAGNLGGISGKDSLILFESIKID